jgi:hypothetical protein
MLEEPGAVVPHAGILCGGCRVTSISTVTAKALLHDFFWR